MADNPCCFPLFSFDLALFRGASSASSKSFRVPSHCSLVSYCLFDRRECILLWRPALRCEYMAFFAGRRTRRDAYTTTNDQLDSEAPDPTRRIQWTVPLRATRRLYKLADEEHGTVATSIESHRLRDKPPRPKISPKFIAHHDRQTLDIAQTRSYPENEKQETVILTRQDPETHVAGHAASSEIHWV